MVSIFRLGTRPILNQILRTEQHRILGITSRNVVLKPLPAETESGEGHDERNMKLGRPQSPHLTIYAPQLTSMTSITHRATGMALAMYAMGLAAGALTLPNGYIYEHLDNLADQQVLVLLAKSSIALPLAYHYCNGIRHLSWDLGIGLNSIRTIYMSGYVMLICATIGSVMLIFGLNPEEAVKEVESEAKK